MLLNEVFMSIHIHCTGNNAQQMSSVSRLVRPITKANLKSYVNAFLDMNVPDKKICPGHCAPMDYLWHAFSCDFASSLSPKPSTLNPNSDCIVWANRGGGKTQLAAALTLLDCIFKPNCQVRILGGSLEQSGRMYEYLVNFAEANFADAIKSYPRRAVKSIRVNPGLAVTAFDLLSPQRIGRRVDTEFFPDSLGELLRVLAFVVEVSPLRE